MATDEVMKSYFARFISHEMMFMIFSSDFHGIFTNLSFIVILSFKSPLKFWKQLWLWFLVVAINMQSLEHGRYYQSLIFLFKCIKRNRADYISDLFEPRILRYNLRNRDHNLTQTCYNNRYYHNSFTCKASYLWNQLPSYIKKSTELSESRKHLGLLILWT